MINMKLKVIVLFTIMTLLTLCIFTPSSIGIQSVATFNVETTYRAVLTGIEDYPGDRNDLSAPVDDVYAMEDVLQNGGYEIRKLTDSQVTRDNVRDKLTWLKNNANSNDVSLFYYCGHGCWYDGDDVDYQREGDVADECLYLYDGIIRDDELTDRIAEIPGTVIVILDCCKSSGFIGDLEYIVDSSHKIAMFTAHGENQNLFEVPIMKRGLFTFHLIAGLATDTNNDNKITVEETYNTASPIYEDGKDVFGIGYSEGARLYYSTSSVKDTAIITGFTNDRPSTPSLELVKNRRGECEYEMTVNDDNDDIDVFIIWGDGAGGWSGPYDSGEDVTRTHTYSKTNDYKVSAIIRDKHGAISDWTTEKVDVKSRMSNLFCRVNFRLLEFFKKLFPILFENDLLVPLNI